MILKAEIMLLSAVHGLGLMLLLLLLPRRHADLPDPRPAATQVGQVGA
jgi:hypothetical protein